MSGLTLTLSTLNVSSINNSAPGVSAYSTLNVSTLNAVSSITVSTLTVSSINGGAPGIGNASAYSTLNVSSLNAVSTLTTSSINVTTGTVGIGTANPRRALDVVGAPSYPLTNAATQLSLSDSSNSALMNLLLGTNATNNYASIQASLSGTGPEPLALNPAGGNVGIGTTYPQTTLQLYNSSNPKIYLNGPPYNGFVSLATGSAALDFGFDTTSISGSTTGGIIRFMPNGSEVMRITNGGSVGIGTASPSVSLHLVGQQWIDSGNSTGLLKMATQGSACYIESAVTSTSGSAAPLYFTSMNASNIWMTLSSSGYLGIGTASPSSLSLIHI